MSIGKKVNLTELMIANAAVLFQSRDACQILGDEVYEKICDDDELMQFFEEEQRRIASAIRRIV